ncbi:hypothetical protein Tsubulata_016911 [Turnera subulata]|uniref:C2H2-type domain-containing protein n=1 Tax=Turnera subulata TaxID=218843 RepID=A0A9Q0G0X8_9ROSI|nr:hypothetical protein Tsubulata_016911 [Turnera subulata]
MGQDQKKMHVCKLCNKRFLSGKMLGGHMRVHGASSSIKAKLKPQSRDMGFDGCNTPGYGLRENPKKSWRFSGSPQDDGAAFGETLGSKVCGREFGALKSLHGHMTHHSEQERRAAGCKMFQERKKIHWKNRSGELLRQKPPINQKKQGNLKQTEVSIESRASSRSNLVLMSISDSDTGIVSRRKRSSRMRYKIHPDSSFSSLNESETGCEIEQEMQEVAVCLIMLSRGERRFGGFHLLYQKRSKETEDANACDGDKSFFDEVDYDDKPIKTKRPREEEINSCASQCEIEKESWTKGEFKCRICDKILLSHQALGGHQTLHRRMKHCTALRSDNTHEGAQTEFSPQIETRGKFVEPGSVQDAMENEMDGMTLRGCEAKKSGEVHRCSICFRSFPSARALGGHKGRAHVGKAKVEQTLAVKQEVPNISDVINVNLPYKLDADVNHDVESIPWLARSGRKHEPLVFV